MLVGDVLVPPPPPPDEVVADVGAALPPVPTAVPVLPAVPFAAADGLAAPPLCAGGGVKISAIASQKQAMQTPTRKIIIKLRFTRGISIWQPLLRRLPYVAPPAGSQALLDTTPRRWPYDWRSGAGIVPGRARGRVNAAKSC